MMPALASAMSSMVSPSHSVWSRPMGVMTRVLACNAFVESSVPQADFDHRDADRGVGELTRAIAVVMSK